MLTLVLYTGSLLLAGVVLPLSMANRNFLTASCCDISTVSLLKVSGLLFVFILKQLCRYNFLFYFVFALLLGLFEHI